MSLVKNKKQKGKTVPKTNSKEPKKSMLEDNQTFRALRYAAYQELVKNAT